VKLRVKHHLPCVFGGRQPDFRALKWRPLVHKYMMVSGDIKGRWGQGETHLLHSRESACSVAADRKAVSHGRQLAWR